MLGLDRLVRTSVLLLASSVRRLARQVRMKSSSSSSANASGLGLFSREKLKAGFLLLPNIGGESSPLE